jgi:hypothetical protein
MPYLQAPEQSLEAVEHAHDEVRAEFDAFSRLLLLSN